MHSSGSDTKLMTNAKVQVVFSCEHENFRNLSVFLVGGTILVKGKNGGLEALDLFDKHPVGGSSTSWVSVEAFGRS